MDSRMDGWADWIESQLKSVHAHAARYAANANVEFVYRTPVTHYTLKPAMYEVLS